MIVAMCKQYQHFMNDKEDSFWGILFRNEQTFLYAQKWVENNWFGRFCIKISTYVMFSKVECHNVNSSIKCVIKKERYAHFFYLEFIKIVNIYAITCDGPYTQNIYRKFVELKQAVISFLFFSNENGAWPVYWGQTSCERSSVERSAGGGNLPVLSFYLCWLFHSLQFKYHSGNIPLPFLEYLVLISTKWLSDDPIFIYLFI